MAALRDIPSRREHDSTSPGRNISPPRLPESITLRPQPRTLWSHTPGYASGDPLSIPQRSHRCPQYGYSGFYPGPNSTEQSPPIGSSSSHSVQYGRPLTAILTCSGSRRHSEPPSCHPGFVLNPPEFSRFTARTLVSFDLCASPVASERSPLSTDIIRHAPHESPPQLLFCLRCFLRLTVVTR